VSLPRLNRDYTISKLACQLLGSLSPNSRDLVVQVKDAWVASGWWAVTRSCDGTTIASSDLWADYTDLQGLGGSGGYSWLTIRNSATGVEVCFAITVTGSWTEMQVFVSVAAGFTGGDTIGNRPTATDEYEQTQGVGADWLGTGPAADAQFRAFNWVSDDGMNTRTAWMFGGNLVAWWQFDTLFSTAGTEGSWVPFATIAWEGGNNYAAPSTRMLISVYAACARHARTPAGVNETPGVFTEEWIANYFVDAFPQNEFTEQYYWTPPMGLNVSGVAAPRKGPFGFFQDQWWVGLVTPGGAPVFTDGDTAGDGAFIFFGQMMLPWDGTTSPPGIAAPTDRAATAFFGRDSGECECGGDGGECITRAQLIDGGKVLADKERDDSITEETWQTWTQQGYEDLWRKVVNANPDSFFQEVDFTLVGGSAANTYDVSTIEGPDGQQFRRLLFVEKDPDTAIRRRIPQFALSTKDGLRGPWGTAPWDDRRRYKLLGEELRIEPYEYSAGNYRLYYIPGPLVLTSESCVEPILLQWREYVEVFIAIKALGKEESDTTSPLGVRLEQLRQDIIDSVPNYDSGEGATVTDVEETRSRGPWSIGDP